MNIRARTPIKFTEVEHEGPPRPGKSWIRMDPRATENDLDLRIWKLDGIYTLELSFPLPTKDSLLAVDSHGKLKAEEKKRLDQPYIRFTMPDGKVRLISFGCAKGLCRGVWPRFPFDETRKLAVVKVEVNLRGLAGHTWVFRYNQIRPEIGAVVFEKRESVRLEKTDAFIATKLYTKGLYTPPGAKSAREPSTVYEWLFSKDEKLQATAYHRVGVTTLYEIHEGDFVVDVSIDGVSLESFEVHARDRLWIEPGTILAFKSPQGGKIHRLEF